MTGEGRENSCRPFLTLARSLIRLHVFFLPVVWMRMLTTASDGWGMEYPQKVTRGLQKKRERSERRVEGTSEVGRGVAFLPFFSSRPLPVPPLPSPPSLVRLSQLTFC